jgi:nucleoside 2-deoxyribosyltransferase
MSMTRKTIYLASPLGFSPENSPYLHKVKQRLVGLGFEVFDPWEQKGFEKELQAAFAADGYLERVDAFRRLASDIGACNERGIAQSDIVFAILDGAEVDSGTASEVGFGSALGKKCYGLRTDLRDSGDFVGVPINLQVLHFIERSGGVLFRTVEEIVIP